MGWFAHLRGRRREPGPASRAVLDQLAAWLQEPRVGYEKQVAGMLETMAKSWQVPPREASAPAVMRFFEERLVQLELGTTGLEMEIDCTTAWWDTPSGHIFSLHAKFDRQVVGDRLTSGRLYQVGRVGANRYLIVGR